MSREIDLSGLDADQLRRAEASMVRVKLPSPTRGEGTPPAPKLSRADLPDPSQVQRVTLAPPPSANHLWERMGRRRRRTSAYEAWLLESTRAIADRLRPVRAFPVAVRITVSGGKGFATNRDLDNSIKPILDLVRLCGVLPDDTVKQVVRIEATFVAADTPGGASSVTVTVVEGWEPDRGAGA